MASNVSRQETVKAKPPDKKVEAQKQRVRGRQNYEDQRRYPSDRPGPLGRR